MNAAALTPALARLPRRELTDGVVVLTAASFRSRLRGLLGADDLPARHGLLLTGTGSVHTLGMRFALDLIWLARDGSVLRVDEAVARGRHRRCRGARAVIETRAGDGSVVALAVGAPGVAIVDGH